MDIQFYEKQKELSLADTSLIHLYKFQFQKSNPSQEFLNDKIRLAPIVSYLVSAKFFLNRIKNAKCAVSRNGYLETDTLSYYKFKTNCV